MKIKIKKVFTTLFMGLITTATYSQTDSVKIEYSQEKITKVNKIDQAICDILTRREKREKDIWKFNMFRTFFDGFNMSYEKKIARKWSLDFSSVTNISGLSFYRDHFYFPKNNSEFNVKENLSFELRFYHNLERRTRLGRKAGFSGNYFGLRMNSAYNYQHAEYYVSDYPGFNNGKIIESRNFQFTYSLNFIYGIQRKIGRIGYIDAGAGLGIVYLTASNHFWNYKKYTFEINTPLKFGIGIAF